MRGVLAEVPKEKCEQLANVTLASTQLCAGSVSGRESCFADNGGPLMSESINGNHFVVGILSIRPECGSSGVPFIYTRVWQYKDWILSNIKP